MVKFTDADGKVFAVNKALVANIRDTSLFHNGTLVQASVVVAVGTTSFTINDTIDNVMGKLA
jgi:hypothetical protein